MSDLGNIANALHRMARERPSAPAIYFPHLRTPSGRVAYTHYTYAQLNAESDRIARGLIASGVGKGVRTVLMVKPSLEFFALTFGIFKAGAVPVLVDPGMGLKNLRVCLGEAQPEAFIGTPTAHLARLVLGWSRDTLRQWVTVGRRLGWGGITLDQVRTLGEKTTIKIEPTTPADPAAILFTSGSTGVPKGVAYTHGNFIEQVELIRSAYDIHPGEIDLPTFPLFALFDPALGMTTVIPDMDPRHPAKADPAKLIEAIEDFGVTNMFGSPALLKNLGEYDQDQVRLPTLRRIISAGAPVPAQVMERCLKMMPEGALIHTPYGATEALPVSTISSQMLLGETWAKTNEGAGVCVGQPLPQNQVRVIAIDDGPIPTWDANLTVPQGTIGEIVVQGPTVTRAYFNRDASTALAKIQDDDAYWHRMGDVGYLDAKGRLWYCGRKAHRVELANGPLYTIPVEAIFNTHPAVSRTALVAIMRAGEVTPVLVIEREPDKTKSEVELAHELATLGAEYDHTRVIQTFLFHPSLPVDIRHNAKIGREALAVWAAQKVPGASPVVRDKKVLAR